MTKLTTLIAVWNETSPEAAKPGPKKYAEMLEAAGATAEEALEHIRTTQPPAVFNYAKVVLAQILKVQGLSLPQVEPVTVQSAEVKTINLKVQKGDWGKKVFELDGFLALKNRPVLSVDCRTMAKDWRPDVGVVTLIPRPEGGYYIADGQHRLWTACHLITGVSTFCARVHFVKTPKEAKELMSTLNTTRKFRFSDVTASRALHSMWPEVFAGYKLFPAFSASRTELNWGPIIKAHLVAARDQLQIGTAAQKLCEDAYETASAEELAKIERTAADLAFWRPFWDAKRGDHKWVTATPALSFMLALSRQNEGQPKLLDAPQRLARWPGLERKLESSNLRYVVDHLLTGVNFRQREGQWLSINGRTGREV